MRSRSRMRWLTAVCTRCDCSTVVIFCDCSGFGVGNYGISSCTRQKPHDWATCSPLPLSPEGWTPWVPSALPPPRKIWNFSWPCCDTFYFCHLVSLPLILHSSHVPAYVLVFADEARLNMISKLDSVNKVNLTKRFIHALHTLSRTVNKMKIRWKAQRNKNRNLSCGSEEWNAFDICTHSGSLISWMHPRVQTGARLLVVNLYYLTAGLCACNRGQHMHNLCNISRNKAKLARSW